MRRSEINPPPTPEEAAAIVAALAALSPDPRADADEGRDLKRQRWRLAGLMGGPPPRRLAPGASLWSYSSWEGMV
ncbi:Hypothetical Protein RradSPS_0453 [Rubrobacter radiotolerans]|uniref:Acyl-CoA carboxylase epsilon subunit n=1 Tax=Rubrobacter radiotolerans TaxID=42256 RepID=A0A023X0J5_RUBRA|nr:hypothetical protein [Rubrobacter radiotolerans]AHY45736.1 Hypothetical Protein RradSPS_0453 [Rubrobacter radiotolerans]MDX5893152.1 hypothetical protein [Rubrobacter radiotolerans]SMC03168.1 conserved hypothetical protein [Rubrobacter radiotolerans DSM 5868]